MTIEITGCSTITYWYRNEVGKRFDADDNRNNKEKKGVNIKYPTGPKTFDWRQIDEKDFKIIS